MVFPFCRQHAVCPDSSPRSIRAKQRRSVEEAEVPSNGRRIRNLGEEWTATHEDSLRS
jgi:hypothetical protein